MIQQTLGGNFLCEFEDVLQARKYCIREIVDKLSSEDRKLLIRSLPSVIHMSMNRLFVSSNREILSKMAKKDEKKTKKIQKKQDIS